MFNRPVRNIHDFILSTYFADGLRITFGILFPSLVLAQFGLLQHGITVSLGALCVSIVDSPGPIKHRRNAMLITSALLPLIAICVGLNNRDTTFTAIVIIGCSFIFSMLFIYGVRAASVGTAALLIMVLSIDDVRQWQEVITYAGILLVGGLWYSLLSYIFYRIRPYRLVRQFLSECVQEIADFLRVKAAFYDFQTNYAENYAKLLELQVSISEKQDSIRELLFKTREIVRESTPESRFLILVFVDMVDIFEQIMSTYYDYEKLHAEFDGQGVLADYQDIILKMSQSLDEIAFNLKTTGIPHPSSLIAEDLKKLQQTVIRLENKESEHQYSDSGIAALKHIGDNMQTIFTRMQLVSRYFDNTEKAKLKPRGIDGEKFLLRQDWEIRRFKENLSLRSSTFRHSLRVAIAMIVGFAVAKTLDFSHSYWILLTILVILKPGFTLTKQRNYQRLIGTIVGAVLGMGILTLITSKSVLFVILLVCMVGCYSFQRKNYVVSVIFMTPYILMVFDFLGIGGLSIAQERIYDTLIGSAIALVASYVLFPNWEHEKLQGALIECAEASLAYFKEASSLGMQNPSELTNYKIARKSVYVSSANLGSIFQRMFSEPKSKQMFMKELQQYTALNHMLASYVATLATYFRNYSVSPEQHPDIKTLSESVENLLNLSIETLKDHEMPGMDPKLNAAISKSYFGPEKLIVEQLDLIQKVSYDLFKLSAKLRI